MRAKQQSRASRMTEAEWSKLLSRIDGRTLGAMTTEEECFVSGALSLSRRIGEEKTKRLTADMHEMYDTGGTRKDVERLLANVAACLPVLN